MQGQEVEAEEPKISFTIINWNQLSCRWSKAYISYRYAYMLYGVEISAEPNQIEK